MPSRSTLSMRDEISHARAALQAAAEKDGADRSAILERLNYLKITKRRYEDATRLEEPHVFVSFAENDRGLSNRTLTAISGTDSTDVGPRFKISEGFRAGGDH